MALQKNAHGLYETVIDKTTYCFSTWGTRRALDGLIELSDICGEFLAKAAGVFTKKDALKQEVSGDVLGDIMSSLVRGMTKDKNTTLNLIERLVTEGVSRDGKDVDFSRDFDENLLHLFKVLRAALEVQYGSFFAGAKDMGILPAK